MKQLVSWRPSGKVKFKLPVCSLAVPTAPPRGLMSRFLTSDTETSTATDEPGGQVRAQFASPLIGFLLAAFLGTTGGCTPAAVETQNKNAAPTVALTVLSYEERHAAVMFIESQDVPKLFETCKKFIPNRSAAYDAVWNNWQERNRVEIVEGERIFREVSKREGKDPDAYLRHESEVLPATIQKMPHAEQIERCQYALDSLLKES